MARNVLVLERSPLAKNVYLMILSSLDEINLIERDLNEDREKFRDAALTSDLIVASHGTLGEKRTECLKILSEISKKKDISAVVFVPTGSKRSWDDFEKIDGVRVIERPFFPDDLLAAVKELWGSR